MLQPIVHSRRALLKGAGAIAAATILPARSQSAFPNAPVRFIVPLAAGGVADVTTRTLVPELENLWKRPVIVENKPGGLFTIGMNAIAQAPADGHTLIYLFNSLATIQVVHKKFNLQTQLQPITESTFCPMVVMAGPNSRFKSIQELVAFGRANPGKLTYASLGVGSIEHLKAAQFALRSGFEAVNVPYKSGPDMVKDVIGGQVDYVLTIASLAMMFVPSGKARLLAILDDKRMKEVPDVPTMADAGLSVPPLAFWGGYAVRAGTPPDIVGKLHHDIAQVAASPAVAEKIAKMTMTAVTSRTPADFSAVIASDMAWMTEVVKALDLKPES